MAAPLGLKLYNLGQRHEAGRPADRPPRPAGELAWLHAPAAAHAGALFAFARRLIDEDGMAVLLTCAEPLSPRDGVILQSPPADSAPDVRQFLDHWRPGVAVFADGELRPGVLHEADLRKIPLFLVNARAPHFQRERDAWYPGLMRSALSRFAHVAALDEPAARQFRKAGASLSAVSVTGRMEEESATLPCLEAERAALARLLAARPVWFAAGITPAEEASVIDAHRTALKQAHRLLLIVMPADAAQAADLAHRLEGSTDWIVANRMTDEEPQPDVEVMVVDNPAEYGLWYRLAPVTFLGGSLMSTGPTRNPLEAAGLGSAIIHGPRTAPYAAIIGRLAAARATRAVASKADLGEAVGDLLAPDRAARLAHAAWSVVSDGADVSDRLLDRIRQATGTDR
jgi:3-deoxy-D-manno-octulosonic-acid transferase